MKIVIELDEILYGEFLTYGIVGLNVDNQIEISKAIKNGTPLPEHHGLAIKALEIELLTDKEQRIFLKAINREREVCQKVDDEYSDKYSDNDSKVSLVKVCNSIERKVKKIWE